MHAALPSIPGFEVAASSRPRSRGGGDYHAVFTSPGRRRMTVAVGDVAGHDATAARLVEIAGGLLKSRAAMPGRLGELMTSINRGLTRHLRCGRYMTLFLAVMMAEDRSIHWVSAGHAPVLAYDPMADMFAEVPGHDIPLGVDPEWTYRELDHTGWAAGALLVIGTDGIWEARNPLGEMYGRERLIERVHAARTRNAAAIVAAVDADLAGFRRDRPPDDDATLLVVKAV
ncbi:MAG TPA: PP2C family protein-serine/threonine phosphatase [Magnetospirillum sp.]|nr:PP2C family protein-serine/threonine phosphatase [Magnetospirillum sp.]